MGKTYNQKVQKREENLSSLPKSQRTAKMAQIKKKEGRVLNAEEKHALQMLATPGKILQAWEIIRTSAGSANAESDKEHAKRHKQIDEVLATIFENFSGYIRTPKVSRVVQSCIKHGTSNHHTKLAGKIVGASLADYCTDAFAHHCILALFRHASRDLFDELYAAILTVASQIGPTKHGFAILCALFSHKYASTQARGDCLLSHTLLGSAIGPQQTPGYPVFENILKNDNTGTVRVRSRVVIAKIVDKLLAGFENATAGKKGKNKKHQEAAAVASAATAPPAVAGATDLEASYAQRLLRAYFVVCTNDEAADAAGSLSQNIVPLLQSKDGVLSVCNAFAAVEPTLRRPMLRQIGTHLGATVFSKFGAPFVARTLDFLYDPQLAVKFIFGPLTSVIGQIMESPYSHMILLHPLTPDQEQKRKALLPIFLDMNLYSRENDKWNKFNNDVIVCEQPAEKSHAIFLNGILPAVAKWAAEAAAETEKNNSENNNNTEELTGTKKKANEFPGKLALSRVAKELYNLKSKQDPLLIKVMKLGLSPTVLDQLLTYVPNKMFRTDNNNNNEKEGTAASPTTAGARRGRTEDEEKTTTTASPSSKAQQSAKVQMKKKQQQAIAAVSATTAEEQEDEAEDEDAPTTKSARRKPGMVGRR